jgi:hypothetical protein
MAATFTVALIALVPWVVWQPNRINRIVPMLPKEPRQVLLGRKTKQDKSAASFCHQVAAQVMDIFCNIYLMRNHTILNSNNY